VKNRKKNRLGNYDYSQNGIYFVTICTKDRIECFGEIKDGEMILNKTGNIIKKYWLEISSHFKNILIDEFTIMPNHIHGIIEINNVGNAYMRSKNNNRSKMLLSKSIQGFKTAVSKELHEHEIKEERACAFPTIIWQKSYFDHIIRNDESLNKIREYIQINPKMWERDRNNAENIWM
jgi:REP element-mobilizing transposase RayT